MRIYLLSVLAFLMLPFVALAAQQPTFSPSVIPLSDNQYYLGSTSPNDAWRGLYVNNICLSGDCRSAWPGGSSNVVGTIATSTLETKGQVPYFSSTSGYPATVASIATSTFTISGPFVIPNTLGAVIGGSGTTITYTGLATTSQPSSSNVLVSNGGAGVYGVATSTLTPTAPLGGSFTVIGSTGSLTCTTCVVTSRNINTNYPLTGGGSLAGDLTLGFSGLSTTSPWTQGQLAEVSNGNTLFSTGTSSLSISGPFKVPAGTNIVGSGGSVTYWGLATTSQPASANLLVSDGTSGVFGVGTSSATINNGLTGTLTTINSQTQTIGLASIANGNVLGFVGSGSGVPTAQATSTLYGAVPNGKILIGSGGAIAWGATTTAGTGLSYNGSSFNVNTSQSISTLSNLTNNGFVITTGGTGALSVQTLPCTTAQGCTATSTNGIQGQVVTIGSGGNVHVATSSLFVNSNQFVGIGTKSGTTSPWALLSVNPDSVIGTAPAFAIGSSTGTTFVVANNGFVGIGTTSPYADFTVNATAGVPAFVVGSSTGVLNPDVFQITASGTASSTGLVISDLGTTGCLQVNSAGVVQAVGSNCGTAGVSSIAWSGGGAAQTGAITLGTSTDNTTGLTSALTITNSSAAFTFTPKLSGTLNTASGGTNHGNFTAGDVVFAGSGGTSLTEDANNFFYNSSLHLLGIGTSTPQWSLTIASSTGEQLVLTDTTKTSAPWGFRSINGNLYFSTSSPTTFATSTGQAALTIAAGGVSGLFGIGSSSPSAALSITANAGYSPFMVGSSTNPLAWIDSLGKFNLRDIIHGWPGIVSPTRTIVLSFGTSSPTWTGTSTPGVDASASTTMSFAGTIQRINCTVNTWLGIQILDGATALAPYIVASSTIGTVIPSGSNTFSEGDVLGLYAGTTTSATAKGPNTANVSGSCTLYVTQTS